MKIKGFDKDLKCRGYQFEIGKTYDTGAPDGELKLCTDTVFHYCDSASKVHEHYRFGGDNRYCEIEVLGAEVTDKEKSGSNRTRIVREITGDELDILTSKINGNTGLFNSGNRNSGDRNSGNRNSGNWNIGNRNSGNRNSGNWNIGNRNSGDRNSGDRNSGNWNSGNWNSCDGSNGVFCSKEDKNIRIFNKPSGMSLSEFRASRYMRALISSYFPLTQWVNDDNGDHLESMPYKEACRIWWENMTEENRTIVKQIPNFDAEVFYEITGIDLRGKQNAV